MAGAGTGSRPWSERTQPDPTATGCEAICSTPSASKPGAGADDVDDGVDRADLMEVHVLDRLAVGLRLGRGEGGKDRERRVAHRRRQG